MGKAVLDNFLYGYGTSSQTKIKTIKALLKNLTNDELKFIDLNGDLVKLGSENTFLNNLTEANRASLSKSFKVINGVSSDFSAGEECAQNIAADIIFNYLSFFILTCKTETASASSNKDFSYEFKEQPDSAAKAGEFSLGIEKNPWCMAYYGVRAQSEPKIPFLPISTIKLSALSFAKPFGGSVGPRFYKQWGNAENKSTGDKTEAAAPIRNAGAGNTQATAEAAVINFSNFVGDNKGLSDGGYIGKYQKDLIGSKLGDLHDSVKMADWNNASDLSANAMVKNLEMSVVAPNQFDLTYYSIDPDFENNYYKGKMESGSKFYGKLQTNTGATGLNFSQDFGGGIMKQIEAAKSVKNNNFGANMSFLPDSWKSLLTGWTFLNLTNAAGYSTFPSANTTMKFGKCEDSYTDKNDNKSLTEYSSNGSKFPPTPGNCVTGGRTGYSVKIVSQDFINGLQGPIGGEGTEGFIRNKIPDRFLNFQ